uniref:Zygote arrest 1 like n=1 Tax=Gopherus evgoodei TaxID=1825980 RepID=A0A8C4XWV2_9SAUR
VCTRGTVAPSRPARVGVWWAPNRSSPSESKAKAAALPWPADYLDGYMWAQLKALLSQVSPGLTPRLRKANTKEVGVQVNPGMDASVQCSMGTCTLQGTCPQSSSASGSATHGPGEEGGSRRRAGGAAAEEEPSQRSQGADTAPSQQLQPEETEAVLQGEGAAEVKRSTFQVGQASSVPSPAAQLPPWWQVPVLWQSAPSSRCTIPPTEVITKLSLLQWESAYTYSKTRCSCPRRHIDLKRLHRQELCGHCKGKRLFCDNTYSFKYIV